MKCSRIMIFLISLFFYFSLSGQTGRTTYNIVDFGAEGDGTKINTPFINMANWGPSLPDFYTNGIEVRDFERLYIDNYRGRPAHNQIGLSAIHLLNGKNVKLDNCQVTNNSDLMILKDVIF